MSNKDLYKDICSRYPAIPVFIQHWWMDVACALWDVAIATKGDMTTGVWPYAVERRMGVSLLRTPVLTPYCGPYVLYPHDVKTSRRDAFEHEVVTGLMEQLPPAKVWHLAMFPGFKQAGLLQQSGLQPQVQQTFLLDLTLDEQVLFDNCNSNTRRNIRAAEKELTIEAAPGLLADLYRYQAHTLMGKGRSQAYALADMQRLFDACVAQGAGMLWAAKQGDNVQAIIWNVWDAERSYYYMGAQNPGADSSKAKTLLIWHAIKEAKKRGNKTFDFEGSMDPGVEHFFRNFGGTRELYLVAKKNTSILWKLKQLIRK